MKFSAFKHAWSLRPSNLSSFLGVIYLITTIWSLFLFTIDFYLFLLLTHGTNAQIANSSFALSFVFLMDTSKHLFIESMRFSLSLAEELLANTLWVHFHCFTRWRVNMPMQHLFRVILRLKVPHLLLDWCCTHQSFLLFLVRQELFHSFWFYVFDSWLHFLLHLAHLPKIVTSDIFTHVYKTFAI